MGPTVFRADKPYLGGPSKSTPSFDYHTRQPGKTSYDEVCGLEKSAGAGSEECAVVFKSIEGATDVLVSAFAGPDELRSRLRSAYDQGFGDTPVAVFDIDLDDFLGRCGEGMSPLLRTLAETSYDETT